MEEPTCVLPELSHSPEVPNNERRRNIMSALGESVSFGRFLSESLEWGKWSSFSHNKYLEEAEQHSQRGSVAQKKAFFEAHYKRIAALKAAGASGEAAHDITDTTWPEEEETDHCLGTAGSHIDSSCAMAEPEEQRSGPDAEEAFFEAHYENNASEESETITDYRLEERLTHSLSASGSNIDSSCTMAELNEQCSKPDAVVVATGMNCNFGDESNGLQVQSSPILQDDNFMDTYLLSKQTNVVDTLEKQPLKESSLANQDIGNTIKKGEQPSKFNYSPSAKKVSPSSAKKASPLHSTKENSSPLSSGSKKQVTSSINQKRPTPSSMKRCEIGDAASSRNLSSSVAAKTRHFESARQPVKATQCKVNEFRIPTKEFLKGASKLASGTDHSEERRDLKETSVKEIKFLGVASSSLHPKTNRGKEKEEKADSETDLKELPQSFCFKARRLPNFYRRIKQAKDSSQKSTLERMNLEDNHHPPVKPPLLDNVSPANSARKGSFHNKQICCFPLRRVY